MKEKYEFLTEADMSFLALEQKTNKKLEDLQLEKTLNAVGATLITLENNKTISLAEALALKFFRECYEHPTAKNIEMFAKLTGQFKEKAEVDVNDVTAKLFSCIVKPDDQSKTK